MPSGRVLISACLVGQPVRYDGASARQEHPALAYWRAHSLLVPLCPEIEGGLPTPRPPAEIQDKRVITINGDDVTEAFHRGAEKAVQMAQQQGCVMAVLKARSPSCGVAHVYSGRFDGQLTSRSGITAALLAQKGLALFTEEDLEEAWIHWCRLTGLRTTSDPSQPSGR